LYSVGHGKRPAEELVATLRSVKVELVVDVRTAPGSRRHPQFGRDALVRTFQAAGMGYVWRKGLGGFRHPRPDSANRGLRNASFRGYADYMATPEFDAAVQWLAEAGAERPTAFLCAETLWWRCHRRMIADALTVRGHTVAHLLRPGRTEPHVLHPAARVVDGGLLVYDRGGEDQQQMLSE